MSGSRHRLRVRREICRAGRVRFAKTLRPIRGHYAEIGLDVFNVANLLNHHGHGWTSATFADSHSTLGPMTQSGFAIAVLAGGPSSEAEVSRTSARAVRAALESGGHRPTLLELDARLPAALVAGAFDVVFPVTHGPLGEDGCVQGLLEVLGLPYVGSGVLASAVGMSKPHAKVLFRATGLPVASDALVRSGDDLDVLAPRLREKLGRSVVVKPASGGSAIGIGRINEQDEDSALVQALHRAFAVDSVVLVESFRLGLEVTCGILEDEHDVPRALPPTLIMPRAADWYDFKSRYAAKGSEHRCPAPFAASLTERIQRIAEAAHRTLGARDLSRADFVVREDGSEDGGEDDDAVTLLEVNTLPGMTATSLYPEAAGVAGVSFVDLCDRLARRAHARPARVAPAVQPMPDSSGPLREL